MSIYNIQDARAPFMLLQGCSTVLPWEEGALFSRRLRATAVQVSASTLQLYPDDALRFGPNWGVMNCTPTRGALCLSTDSGVALMGTRSVTTPRDLSAIAKRSALLQALHGAACTSDQTGRVVGDTDLYTVSMCDLVEGAFRFVLQHSEEGDLVFWIRDTTGVLENTVLAVIAVYAATSLAQNLSSMISKSPAPVDVRSATLNFFACVVSVAVLIGMCEAHREYYVSQLDVDLYNVLLAFLLADVMLFCLKIAGPRDASRNFGHQVGLSTVVLLLVSLRLHNTFNTPFVNVLLGLFGVRTLCKLLQHLHDSARCQARDINLVSVVLDLCVWCCLLAYCIAQSTSVQDEIAVAVNATVAMLLGLGMSVMIAEHAA
jgi:hypothetical protein